MKRTATLCFITCLLALGSCDKEVGEKGVVEDATTGERLRHVVVKMTSSQGNVTDTTDTNGYFNVFKFFSCGIGNCNTDYNIQFIKNGYDTLNINEGLPYSQAAEYVTEGKTDTLLIKLNRLEARQ